MNNIRKFEDFLDKIQGLIDNAKKQGHVIVPIEDIESTFPELKGSEDERHRKWILEYLYDGLRKSDEQFKDQFKCAIDWLEKQKEIDKSSYEIAEKEKYDFVSGQFIECRKSFNEFKENNSYWFEYVGNDTYIGRSDNILNKKFHITPRQLYRLFTQQHCPKENNINEETNAPTGYGKYVNECLHEAAKHFFSEGEDKYPVADLFYAGVRCGQSWLEKQGKSALEVIHEQKPNNKPKFNVDDWIVFNGFVLHVDEIVDGYYRTTSIGGIPNSYDWAIDNAARLWTIADAKCGDVLVASDESLFIFARVKGDAAYYHFSLCKNGSQEISDGKYAWEVAKDCYPATQKQRNLLFQKMKESGYEWNADKKELKKIDNHATWSEDDEKMFVGLTTIVEGWYNSQSEKEKEYYGDCGYSNWLQSLKDRVQPQPKKQWSKEEKSNIDIIVSRLEVDIEYWKSRSKRRVDEDKRIINWLLSLKPQNRWKPSEGQIIALRWVLNNIPYNKHKEEISGLLDQIEDL